MLRKAIVGATAQEHDHAMPGHVSFPVSCTLEAQNRFNAAASLLYSFHWEKVDRALAAVLEADPNCTMVFWAKAIASLDNPRSAELAGDREKARTLYAHHTVDTRDYRRHGTPVHLDFHVESLSEAVDTATRTPLSRDASAPQDSSTYSGGCG